MTIIGLQGCSTAQTYRVGNRSSVLGKQSAERQSYSCCSAKTGPQPNNKTKRSNRRIPTKAMRPAKYSREYRNTCRAFIGYETEDVFLLVAGMLAGRVCAEPQQFSIQPNGASRLNCTFLRRVYTAEKFTPSC